MLADRLESKVRFGLLCEKVVKSTNFGRNNDQMQIEHEKRENLKKYFWKNPFSQFFIFDF